MWAIASSLLGADSATALGSKCILSNSHTGDMFEIDPRPAQRLPTLWGAGWRGLCSLAGIPDGSALLATDDSGVLWRIDSTGGSPQTAVVVGSGLGLPIQLAAPTAHSAYVLGRANRRSGPSLSSRSPWFAYPPQSQLEPFDSSLLRHRIQRVGCDNGVVTTVVSNLRDAGGFALTSDESTAYVTSTTSGDLVAVDLSGKGARYIVVAGLVNPKQCAWLDENASLLLVVEEHALAVIDVRRKRLRRVNRCPGTPRSAAVVGGRIIVAAVDYVATVDAAALNLSKIVLATPTAAIYRGGYARVDIDLGTTGFSLEDLVFDVIEGPDFGIVSSRRDGLFDPAHPQIVLLVGPTPGIFTLRARDSVGTVLATATFQITDTVTGLDGPPMAFTGVNPLYATGGAWGSLFNGVFPYNFTYGLQAVTGQRRVALIFVNTADTTLPAGTALLYRNALAGGVVGADGVTRSVADYYREVSDGRLSITAAGESTVTVGGPWRDYTTQFSTTDQRWNTKNELIQQALWLAQNDIDFGTVDTAVFVVASPNGGLPNPAIPGDIPRFTWPIANGGTYVFIRPPRPPFGWWWKSLPWVVMPAEWEAVDPRRAYETLSHEIGHTLGMPDLYGDPREISGYDIMDTDRGVPSLCLPHQVMLGWVDPRHLRTYNFRVENPVLETITLTATELVGAGPPPLGEKAGIVIEVADGWRYYFEYRSRQNVTAVDPGPAQVADQGMPEDRQVVGTDVIAGSYQPPLVRKPIRLLVDDGDGQGSVLAVGEDYKELDAAGNSTFRLEVLSADDDRANVRVSYQPVAAPLPPWPNGPDPSIRPWPGGDNWQSPDIRIENALNRGNVPWAGHANTIVATVNNGGTIDATNVRVGFWVKDFTASATGTETFLGWDTPRSVVAGGTTEFRMGWTPPALAGIFGILAFAHFCVVVRIAPHSQGNPPRGEVNSNNNEAQSNYTLLWTLQGSPFSRTRLPVQVTNPYPDRDVDLRIHVEQTLDYYRTYVEHTSVRLSAGQSREIEVMIECLADEAPFNDTVPKELLFGRPNIVTAVTAVIDPSSDVPLPVGGATVEVRAARRTEFRNLDVSRTGASGRVVLTDGTPVTAGEVLIATRPVDAGGELSHRSTVGPDGSFTMNLAEFSQLGVDPVTVDVAYLGLLEFGPTTREISI